MVVVKGAHAYVLTVASPWILIGWLPSQASEGSPKPVCCFPPLYSPFGFPDYSLARCCCCIVHSPSVNRVQLHQSLCCSHDVSIVLILSRALDDRCNIHLVKTLETRVPLVRQCHSVSQCSTRTRIFTISHDALLNNA